MDIEIPGVRSAERQLGDGPVVLGPDEGLVAGVAIAAFSLEVAAGLNLSLGRIVRTRFILADAAEQQVSIAIRPPLEDTVEIEEAGVTSWITPFAMKLPAGRHRLIGHARRVAQPTPTGWMFFQDEAPLVIDVRAGEAVNIGGLGQFAHNLVFADRAARDATCPPAWRDDNPVYGPLCSRSEVPFLRHDMARDRARILAALPGARRRDPGGPAPGAHRPVAALAGCAVAPGLSRVRRPIAGWCRPGAPGPAPHPTPQPCRA